MGTWLYARHDPIHFPEYRSLTVRSVLTDKKHALFNTWNVVITLACLATAVLATYASVKSIIVDFQTGTSGTSFSCRSPLQPS